MSDHKRQQRNACNQEKVVLNAVTSSRMYMHEVSLCAACAQMGDASTWGAVEAKNLATVQA